MVLTTLFGLHQPVIFIHDNKIGRGRITNVRVEASDGVRDVCYLIDGKFWVEQKSITPDTGGDVLMYDISTQKFTRL